MMATVYLDTSFVSACVTSRTDPQSVARRETSVDWWSTQSIRHSIFVSAEVINEVSDPEYPNRDAAAKWVDPLPQLPATETAYELAGLLVKERVMPGPASGDAAHVAIATIHGIEYLLSWNVRHLANPNKTLHLRVICERIGLTPPMIVTPDMLWE